MAEERQAEGSPSFATEALGRNRLRYSLQLLYAYSLLQDTVLLQSLMQLYVLVRLSDDAPR